MRERKMMYEVVKGDIFGEKQETEIKTMSGAEAYAKFSALRNDPNGPEYVKIRLSF